MARRDNSAAHAINYVFLGKGAFCDAPILSE